MPLVRKQPAQHLSDLGLVVDAVNEVLDIAASEIEPPPSFGARIRSDFDRWSSVIKQAEKIGSSVADTVTRAPQTETAHR